MIDGHIRQHQQKCLMNICLIKSLNFLLLKAELYRNSIRVMERKQMIGSASFVHHSQSGGNKGAVIKYKTEGVEDLVYGHENKYAQFVGP